MPDNRLKERFTLEIDGRRIIQTRYTAEAEAWMSAVEQAARLAIQALPVEAGIPASWELPLQLDYLFVRVRSELANALKGLNDALQRAFDVDDGHFEFDRIRRTRRHGTAMVWPVDVPANAHVQMGRTGGSGVLVRVRPASPSEALRPQPKRRTPRPLGQSRPGGARRRVTPQTPLQAAIAAALATEERPPTDSRQIAAR